MCCRCERRHVHKHFHTHTHTYTRSHTNSVGDGRPTQFLHVKEEDLESFLPAITETALAEAIKSGVAYYHEGMKPKERKAVEALFAANAIQVLVATKECAWSLPVHAQLVVVMDTQVYDGKSHRCVRAISCLLSSVPELLGYSLSTGMSSMVGLDTKFLIGFFRS